MKKIEAVIRHYKLEDVKEAVGLDMVLRDPKFSGFYKLESVTESVANIIVTIDIRGSGDTKAGKNTMPLDFLMEVRGSFYIDLAGGMLQTGEVNAELAAIGTLGEKEADYRGSVTTTFKVEFEE